MRRYSKRISAIVGATVLGVAGTATFAIAGTATQPAKKGNSPHREISFHMVRSAVAAGANCLRGAEATVTIEPRVPVEIMRVWARDLPPNTDFDLFVIQVPNAPFGISWYQGDLDSNGKGL